MVLTLFFSFKFNHHNVNSKVSSLEMRDFTFAVSGLESVLIIGLCKFIRFYKHILIENYG